MEHGGVLRDVEVRVVGHGRLRDCGLDGESRFYGRDAVRRASPRRRLDRVRRSPATLDPADRSAHAWLPPRRAIPSARAHHSARRRPRRHHAWPAPVRRRRAAARTRPRDRRARAAGARGGPPRRDDREPPPRPRRAGGRGRRGRPGRRHARRRRSLLRSTVKPFALVALIEVGRRRRPGA